MRTSRLFLFFAASLIGTLGVSSAWALIGDLTPKTPVIEYFNDVTGHYFMTSDPAEYTALDAGFDGHTWHRTGHQFIAYPVGYRANVCRFYAPGPNSHFFTARVQECDALRTQDQGWIYEGVKFSVDVPNAGACSTGTPIYRFYNNRAAFNDTNHRHVSAEMRGEMQARGWIDEGIAFCVYRNEDVPAKSFVVDTYTDTAPTHTLFECLNTDRLRGTCLALDGIGGPMNNLVRPYQPPFYAPADPQWSDSYSALTGAVYPLHTAQGLNDTSAVAAHSFVQRWGTGMGLRVSSLDHFSGAVGSIAPMYKFATRASQFVGAGDERVFPWRATNENYLRIGFGLLPRTVRRADAGSHAWGAPVIEFQDATSGDVIDVTLQTFGTIPPGDFVGAVDPTNNHVFVSTVFRADPAFGKRIAGDFIPCAGDGVCVTDPGPRSFEFRIDRADFAKVLTMARAANPRLSADPNDYLLANFRFQAGIFGNADLGLTLAYLHLDVFGY